MRIEGEDQPDAAARSGDGDAALGSQGADGLLDLFGQRSPISGPDVGALATRHHDDHRALDDEARADMVAARTPHGEGVIGWHGHLIVPPAITVINRALTVWG